MRGCLGDGGGPTAPGGAEPQCRPGGARPAAAPTPLAPRAGRRWTHWSGAAPRTAAGGGRRGAAAAWREGGGGGTSTHIPPPPRTRAAPTQAEADIVSSGQTRPRLGMDAAVHGCRIPPSRHSLQRKMCARVRCLGQPSAGEEGWAHIFAPGSAVKPPGCAREPPGRQWPGWPGAWGQLNPRKPRKSDTYYNY